MSDNVTNFPERKPPEILIGPFQKWCVVVGGRKIPHLTGHRENDGKIWLTVDERITFYFNTEEDAYQAASLAANAMAVATGYPHAGAENKDKPFAPRITQIGSIQTE